MIVSQKSGVQIGQYDRGNWLQAAKETISKFEMKFGIVRIWKFHFIGNVNLYIRQAEFDTQIPEFDTQILKFDTQIPEFDTWIRQEAKLAPLSNI